MHDDVTCEVQRMTDQLLSEMPAGEAPPLAELRQSFGARLGQLRESRGLTPSGLAQCTRINQKYIEALESGDFSRLPSPMFGRGFLRSILKNLKTDSSAWVSEFDRLWPAPTPTSVLQIEIRNMPKKAQSRLLYSIISAVHDRWAKKSKASRKIYAGVATLVLTLGAVVPSGHAWLKRHWATLPAHFIKTGATAPSEAVLHSTAAPLTTPQPAVKTERAPSPELALTPADLAAPSPVATVSSPVPIDVKLSKDDATAAVAPSSGGQKLEIVVIQPVRVRLELDKAEPMTKRLPPDTYVFQFNDQANLMVYDAAAVKISFNGHPIGAIGNKGRVRRLSFQSRTPGARLHH